VLALLGAELGGWRTGVIAAALAAVYPNLWLYDGLLMPEALAGLLIALALLVSVRFVRTGRTSLLIWLGVIIGLGALTRGELLLLVPLLALPICLARRDRSIPERLRLAGLVTVIAALGIAPWAVYNLQRFEKPVFISTAQDTTIGGANCDAVYHGSRIGAWSDQCFADILDRNLEESVAASEIRARTAHYVAGHASRLPLVALARFGRTWDLFKQSSNVTLGELQRRPRAWSWIALALYTVLVVLACIGGYFLRRDPALLPLLAMPVLVSLTGVLFWGNPRFRRPAELVIVVLAAVAIDALAAHRQPVPA
jgi:4-amino-4-deoxy-L-arabinose transferase-like glycosyltransferase